MLYEKLKEYATSKVYPMHMPGHKRNGQFMPPGFPCDIDISEIHGFDDMHDPQEVLLETAKLAADLYNCSEAFMLVNGTTVGILAAIGAHSERGDKILAADNCHRSTPNAAELFGLEIEYVKTKKNGITKIPYGISPDSIEEVLENNPDIKLVIITSPTYEGIVSDVSAIANVVHNAGGILIVDSAHGAHFGFSDAFPVSATILGADVVVVSLHKTLAALTQCSLLLACSERVNTVKIKHLLSILQTSSPSYLLMASIDFCLRSIKSDGEKLFQEYENRLDDFSKKVLDLKNLSVMCYGKNYMRSFLNPDIYDFDFGKIVILTSNTALCGTKLADILRTDHKIEIERANAKYVIAMTSICDTSEGLTRLADALCAIDASI